MGRRNVSFAFILVFLFFISCGSKDVKKVEQKTKEKRSLKKEEAVEKKLAFIKELVILPDSPTVESIVEVKARIEKNTDIDIKKIYKFWVNGKIVQESKANLLTPDKFSKKDYIWCDLEVYNLEDGKLIAKRRTKVIKVASSAPKIELSDFPKISGPGKYFLKFSVYDPDDEDVKISLEGKYPEWIKLRKDIMALEIDINEKSKPGVYDFSLKAMDKDGAYSVVNLQFTLNKEKKVVKKVIKKKEIKNITVKKTPEKAPFNFPEYPKIHE